MWACDPALTSTIVQSYQGAGPLFVQALQGFLAAHCALVGDHLWPADAVDAVLEDPNYDFIVVGAGSAGAVVANRLSEISKWKVLLIEAGGNPTLTSAIPQLFFNNFNTAEDWKYKPQPQEGACRSYKDAACAWPRGKTLGGTSSINGMYYVRGNKLDYDEWAAEGNVGWSYDDVLPYFRKSENYSGELKEDNKKYHSKDGYLNVQATKDGHDVETFILNAAAELGLKILDDVNGPSQMGIVRSMFTIKDGVRESTARAFLSPIRNRNNLNVVKNALVTKILFKTNSNAIDGVIFNKNGKDIVAKARKEVIISAGSINSVQLLLLSGIGPQKHLEDMGIEVKANLPVGENLQDHLLVPTFYTTPSDNNLISLPNIVGQIVESVVNRKSLLSDISPHKVISFINTTNSNASSPDIEHHYIVFTPRLFNLIDLYELHGTSKEFHKKFNEVNDDKLVIKVCTVLLKPKSRGRILLKSKDPNDHPLIYANYFDNPEDLRTVLNAIKQYALELGNTETFKKAGFKLEWIDIDACKSLDKKSDNFLECIARELTFSLYHPTSTVKMGPDNDVMAVVDPELKVKHIKGLRVIDASIMPTVVRGNTNAPTIMIAEKGSDLIKKDWLSHDEL